MTLRTKEKDRRRMHQHLDELLDLYGEVLITSQKDWDRNVSNNYVFRSEADRLIIEARIEELSHIPQDAWWGKDSTVGRRFSELSKQVNKTTDSVDVSDKEVNKEFGRDTGVPTKTEERMRYLNEERR